MTTHDGPAQSWDPLAAQRKADDPPLDVLLAGTVFFDIIFTGLTRLPHPGEEIWSESVGSSPGGIANLATATARLGLRTGLVAGFGDDAYADWMWHTLSEDEGIDLRASRQFPDFASALTASMATPQDRAMVTHGSDLPEPLDHLLTRAEPARAAMIDLDGETQGWSRIAHTSTRIFADIGYDATGRWDPADLSGLDRCYAFTPNAVEAMAYTRTDTPQLAVRAIAAQVPLAVVTDGAAGAYAVDATTGEDAFCPALPVTAVDATGAGDVFGAAILMGTLAEWPLMQRLRFASLCSGLAVQRFGGATAAPGWGDIADWWAEIATAPGDADGRCIREEYAFLQDILPAQPSHGRRRNTATAMTWRPSAPAVSDQA